MEYIWGGLNNTSLNDTLPPNRISYTDPICLWRDHRSQIWPKQTKAKEAANQRREPGTLRRWSGCCEVADGWYEVTQPERKTERQERELLIISEFFFYFFNKIYFAVISLTSFKTVDARLPSQQVTAACSLFTLWQLNPLWNSFVCTAGVHIHILSHTCQPPFISPAGARRLFKLSGRRSNSS